MKEIKEKLCKREDLSPNIYEGGEDYKERLIEIVIEETSKAKDEEFIKLLDKLIKKIENADKQIEFDEWETFMIFNIQEIKQRIKDKEIKKLKERIEDLENILQERNERE